MPVGRRITNESMDGIVTDDEYRALTPEGEVIEAFT